ncbi:MAG: L-threonylcarbamoyladenylate synthase [Actinomycetales bacterium]
MLVLPCTLSAADATTLRRRADAISRAVTACKRGDVICLPTESVYALATDLFAQRGTQAIRGAKGQLAQTPLPVMVPNAATTNGIARAAGIDAARLMEAFWPGLLTLLLPAQPTLAWDNPSDAPVAVRMPVHPVTLEVLAGTGPLAVTSANRVGMAAPVTLDQVQSAMGEEVFLGLDAGPVPDPDGLPSTVVDCTGSVPQLVREGAIDTQALLSICPSLLSADGSPAGQTA